IQELIDICERLCSSRFLVGNDPRLVDGANQYAPTDDFCASRGGALDSTGCVGVHCVDFSFESEVWLPQCLAKKSFWFGVASLQCLFFAGNDLGSFRWASAACISDDDGRL